MTMTDALTPVQLENCAQRIASAFHTNTILDQFPEGLSPTTLAEALAIQERVSGLIGKPTVGWKTGYARPEMRRLKGEAAPMVCRLFEGAIMQSPATILRSEMHNPLVEGELAARLGADLPARSMDYTFDEVLDAIDTVMPAIEFADIRTQEKESVTPFELTALNGGSFRLILGEPIQDWRSKDLQSLKATIRLDGEVVASEYPQGKRTDFAWAIHFLANRLSARGLGLRAGEVVSTGVILDYPPIGSATEAVFDLEGCSSVQIDVAQE